MPVVNRTQSEKVRAVVCLQSRRYHVGVSRWAEQSSHFRKLISKRFSVRQRAIPIRALCIKAIP